MSKDYDLMIENILASFCDYHFADNSIGHPAIFGLDLFVFAKAKSCRHNKVRFNYDPTKKSSYVGWLD